MLSIKCSSYELTPETNCNDITYGFSKGQLQTWSLVYYQGTSCMYSCVAPVLHSCTCHLAQVNSPCKVCTLQIGPLTLSQDLLKLMNLMPC